MEGQLTTDQKREYLRLLLTENVEVANAYLNTLRPHKMVFYEDEIEAYEKEHGKLTGLVIIVQRVKPEDHTYNNSG